MTVSYAELWYFIAGYVIGWLGGVAGALWVVFWIIFGTRARRVDDNPNPGPWS